MPDMLRKLIIALLALIFAAGAFAWYYDKTGQKADPQFRASVETPAYTAEHPRVLIDEFHRNFHTASGRYKPFADLLRSDGYIVNPGKAPFSPEILKRTGILIIANALGPDPHEGSPAFTAEEEA